MIGEKDMTNYTKDTLLRDEKIVYWSRPHWIIYSRSITAFIASFIIFLYGPSLFLSGIYVYGFRVHEIIALAVLAVALYWLLASHITYKTSEYAVTNRRILMKTGWIQRYSLEIFLEKIEAVYVNQSVPGRILNYGMITVIGVGGTSDPFYYVPNPLAFRQIVQRETEESGARK